MKDIFEAIEQLSALLSFRIENQARKQGWATKPYSWIISPDEGKLVIVVATTLFLPEGLCASFTPRNEPLDGGRWPIDIRRTDCVIRDGWESGLSVAKTDKKFALWMGDTALSDDKLVVMINDLATP